MPFVRLCALNGLLLAPWRGPGSGVLVPRAGQSSTAAATLRVPSVAQRSSHSGPTISEEVMHHKCAKHNRNDFFAGIGRFRPPLSYESRGHTGKSRDHPEKAGCISARGPQNFALKYVINRKLFDAASWRKRRGVEKTRGSDSLKFQHSAVQYPTYRAV